MKQIFRRLTAFALALTLAGMSLTVSFATEDDAALTAAFGTNDQVKIAEQVVEELTQQEEPAAEEPAEEPAPSQQEEKEQQTPEQDPADGEPGDASQQDPQSEQTGPLSDASGDTSGDTSGDNSGDTSGDSSEEPQEPAEPLEVRWKVNKTDYKAKAAFPYTKKAIRPAYRLMREDQETEKQDSWQEHWYSDAQCTKVTKDFTNCGTIYFQLTEEDRVVAEGSYSITPAKQTITTAKERYTKKYAKNHTIALGAKTSGDGKLTYKSNNTKVVTVSAKGVCTMKGVGEAEITITAPKTKNCKKAVLTVPVTVYQSPKKLSYCNVYKKSKYYKALTALKLLGSKRKNVVAIALSQLGYHEGSSAKQMNGTSHGGGNYTEYGRYYGMNQQPRCAMFVNWCAREAGVSYSVVPKYAAVRYYHGYFKRQKRFHSWGQVRSGGYRPKVGDIILYANVKGGVAHHIGYVISSAYSGKKVNITTVEGNTSDAVRKVHMHLTKSSGGKINGHYILGVASPKY